MPAAPNELSFVNSCVGKYPGAWAKCLAPHDDGSFIRLVARDLNAQNPRWGLNAKRDGSSGDISKDCLAYYVGPTDRHVEVYDVIGAHEDPSARIVWQDMTNYQTIGQPGTARFVHPVSGGGYSGPPVGTNPGIPMYTVSEAIAYLTARKGSQLTTGELNQAIVRAQQLGWDGGATIRQSIIHQIASEMFPPVVTTTIEMTLKQPFGNYPAGTNVKLTIG